MFFPVMSGAEACLGARLFHAFRVDEMLSELHVQIRFSAALF
jgi:hypothetical protein